MTLTPNDLAPTVAAMAALPECDREWILSQLPPAQRSAISRWLAEWETSEVPVADRPDERSLPASQPDDRLLHYVAQLPPVLAARMIAAAPPEWRPALLAARPTEERPAASPPWGEKTPTALWAIAVARAHAMPTPLPPTRRRRWTWGRR